MLGQTHTQWSEMIHSASTPNARGGRGADQNILETVRQAIALQEVTLAYQPIMQAREPNKVAFYEGLVRVLDETGKIIPAHKFIDAVEATELGRQLDTLALAEGLRTLHENPELRLSINMSVRTIQCRQWHRTLNRWLSRDGLIAERLIIEITESSAMKAPDAVASFMKKLQAKGISFALDDFGDGFTALRYFKDFSFDILKIDGQFIQGIAHDPDNRALTAALVSIAQHFNMLTVAEFVDDQEDADTLISLGLDCLQGYHFAKPTTRPYWMQAKANRKAS